MSEQPPVKKKFRFTPNTCVVMIGLLLFCAVVGSILPEPETNNSPDNGARVESTGTQNNDSESTAASPVPTVAKRQKPQLDFSGHVEPRIASIGEKVVITIEVTNLSETETVDGMRIIFANSKFISEALTITNVMSGGVQDGRAFEWSNDLLKIEPKQTKNFVVVAQANKTGNYESVITFRDPVNNDSFDNELVAKLTVIY